MRRKIHKKTVRKQKRKNRRTTRIYSGGTECESNVKCCMCEQMVDKKQTFIPRKCLMKHGDKLAHKICSNCWWNSTTGFAAENTSHRCPGCEKNMPLTAFKKKTPIVVDLTED